MRPGYNCIGAIEYSLIDADGSAKASFDMPESISGVALQGHRIRIDAQWGDIREKVHNHRCRHYG